MKQSQPERRFPFHPEPMVAGGRVLARMEWKRRFIRYQRKSNQLGGELTSPLGFLGPEPETWIGVLFRDLDDSPHSHLNEILSVSLSKQIDLMLSCAVRRSDLQNTHFLELSDNLFHFGI